MNTYNEIWNRNYLRNSQKKGYESSADRFAKKENAENMLNSLLQGTMQRAGDQLASLDFEPGSTVLDIGAGPGTLAVPLAKKGCRVTVVEPSAAMADCMNLYAKHMGVTADIPVIPTIIENLVPERMESCDYVISSFALATPDLLSALQKMNALAKKQVHIFWFVDSPPWVQVEEELRTLIHLEEPPVVRSYANLIWNCLYEEEIYANMTIHPMKSQNEYDIFEDAQNEYFRRLATAHADQKRIISAHLKKYLIQLENGKFRLPDTGSYAHIWWDTA